MVLHRVGAGHRLDAADPAATPPSETIVKKPMSPVARAVRAAAQLHAEAGNRDDPHPVAVFLAEERHRPRRHRFLRRSLFGDDRRVAVNLLVDDLFELQHLLARDGRGMDEVESQTIGRHQRPGLFHVRAEYLSRSAACSRCVAV